MRQQSLRFWLGAVLCTVLGGVSFGCGGGNTPPLPTGDAGSEGGILDGSSMDGALDGTTGPACGDGTTQTGELCDDGNTVGGDGCSADCTSNETCGNGTTDLAAGEVCDDGNTAAGDGCAADCSTDYACGNGVLDTVAAGGTIDEICDDGNNVNGDGCDAACASNETCGNNTVDLGAGEVCDDGNTVDGDDCSADCLTSLLCGNGTMDAGEECDDSNHVDGDGCNMSCQIERCGNGRVDSSEACDDGNADDTDGCKADCAFTCTLDADCADTDLCNGIETCSGGGSLASRCAPGTAPVDGTACGSGLLCNGGACVAVACGDGFTSTGEQCDDGANANANDGCRPDCTFTCTAANAATNCGDANTCTTDTCTGTGIDSRCSNPVATGACTLAGGGTGVCNAVGACVTSVTCGNGTPNAGEQCDDANTNNNDGCRTDCTFTCRTSNAAVNCNDANACTTDACTNSNTIASRCTNTTRANGVTCGGTNICVTGSCVAARCGDLIITAPEQCDDGNLAAADGCENTCRWTCGTAADCADTNVCNGAETCTSGGTLASRCGAGTPATSGTACNDGNAATLRDICLASVCGGSRCGDGYVDSGASPAETCDDGNTTSGDGCSATCTTEGATPPTGFRLTKLQLISPRITVDVGWFLGGCKDATENKVLGQFSVNASLAAAIAPTTATTSYGDPGTYSLHIVDLFRPLGIAAVSSPNELQLNAACTDASPDTCVPAAIPNIVTATANNMAAGTCFAPVAAEVNTRAGTPATYAPAVNTVSGPCFITTPTDLTITVSGIAIPLTSATIAATYSGSPTSNLVSGVVRGFLSEASAAAVILPDLPLVGGDPLYKHLQAGNRTVAGVPAGCNLGGGTSEDDADMNGATRGFWFFLNFTAELVTWSGP